MTKSAVLSVFFSLWAFAEAKTVLADNQSQGRLTKFERAKAYYDSGVMPDLKTDFNKDVVWVGNCTDPSKPDTLESDALAIYNYGDSVIGVTKHAEVYTSWRYALATLERVVVATHGTRPSPMRESASRNAVVWQNGRVFHSLKKHMAQNGKIEGLVERAHGTDGVNWSLLWVCYFLRKF